MARQGSGKGLTREKAGRYRSEDDRFIIEQTGVGWYLTDEDRRDELGQPLLIGPFGSLVEARDAMAAEPSVLKPKAKPKAKPKGRGKGS